MKTDLEGAKEYNMRIFLKIQLFFIFSKKFQRDGKEFSQIFIFYF